MKKQTFLWKTKHYKNDYEEQSSSLKEIDYHDYSVTICNHVMNLTADIWINTELIQKFIDFMSNKAAYSII